MYWTFGCRSLITVTKYYDVTEEKHTIFMSFSCYFFGAFDASFVLDLLTLQSYSVWAQNKRNLLELRKRAYVCYD